jgi:hypothetical protein
MREFTNDPRSQDGHADLQGSRTEKDEAAVGTVMDVVNDWINPFAENCELLSISTAREIPRDIASDLLSAHDVGSKSLSDFREHRLESEHPTKKFHDVLKLNKLKTCTSLI